MRNRLGKYWLLFWVTFGVVIIASGAFIAQAGRDDSPPPADTRAARNPDPILNLSDDELSEVVQVLNLYTLEKELELTDDQLVRVLPKWRRLLEMRREFWRDRRSRLDGLREQVTVYKEEQSDRDEEVLGLAVDNFRREDDTFWAGYRKIEVELLADLAPPQKIQYLLIDSEQGRRTSRLVKTLRRINRPPQPELIREAHADKDSQQKTVATSGR